MCVHVCVCVCVRVCACMCVRVCVCADMHVCSKRERYMYIVATCGSVSHDSHMGWL